MPQVGALRKLDGLGRVVIPREMRWELQWNEDALIKVSKFGRYILLHQYGDERAAPVAYPSGQALFKELVKSAKRLTDQDMLLVLDILERLCTNQNTLNSAGR